MMLCLRAWVFLCELSSCWQQDRTVWNWMKWCVLFHRSQRVRPFVCSGLGPLAVLHYVMVNMLLSLPFCQRAMGGGGWLRQIPKSLLRLNVDLKTEFHSKTCKKKTNKHAKQISKALPRINYIYFLKLLQRFTKFKSKKVWIK